MRRSAAGSSRVPSPTNTTYSGLSSYNRTDSYRPQPPPVPQSDPRAIAQTHFTELSRYLASYLANEPANSRSTARQKLTRLTRQQFQELSTDVYDELVRRKENSERNEVPFLPVRDDFHPKRNQARQKLATLPTNRFKDLSSDVYYELARRYPEFKEDPVDGAPLSPGSTYDDYPSPDFPTSPRSKAITNSIGRASRASDLQAANGGYAPGPSSRAASTDEYANGRRSTDTMGSRRRPSQDTGGRRPSEASESAAQSATAGMVIPTKSTIAEEDIEVPYGRGSSGARGRESDSDGDADDPRPMTGGLAGLSARLQADGDEDELYDKLSFGRASVQSDRSAGAGRAIGGRSSVAGEEQERVRRDYEYKIATMQTRIGSLERDLEGAQQREQQWAESEERVRVVEEELRELRQRMEEKTAAMYAMQQELEALRQERESEKEVEARRARQDEEELQILRERCERLEEERAGGGQQSEILDQLRSDMEGLMVELTDLSRRNDELMTAKDADLAVIRDLDAQLKEYKRKYEQAKTELRSIKATSQLFLQPPKTDDQLPVSPDGGLVDIHVTAFVSAIDSLLTAGRSNAPTRVLTPMKAVVNVVHTILDDVKAYERRPRRDSRQDHDSETLRALRERAEATLSNLVTASKTHATSAGMSPVSLLDAAASHVSLTVTDIGKTVCIRKATRAEQEQFVPPTAGASATNGYAPALRSVDEGRVSQAHSRGGSSASSRRGDSFSPIAGQYGEAPVSASRASTGRTSVEERRGPPSNVSSSQTSSPPPIFDQPATHSTGGMTSDESAPPEGPEDAWAELKPYLEAQTESIVYAIQSVLSGVRSPTPPPTLNENLTQIITIVSSIVAVCKDNLPPASAQQGEDILRELGDHANKLSEVQAQAEVTKESRQIMAKSSFAVANAMKGLMKL
ncbi:hypothetical protein WOLCODRAFT_109116 [Wolfiporia cocos MD-104 SS10]|uniref:GIT Spa2 homology (SHD) domain-containing protein n=1 Tax=Wolfiporia cocos (strain MD-104) TaxID=742152 RepID=A0A2H3JGB7_WOLCO|nr:hypothetical protein WOLCODRAFT_109116 [Wolfiporia cocos MD-104 SS10]